MYSYNIEPALTRHRQEFCKKKHIWNAASTVDVCSVKYNSMIKAPIVCVCVCVCVWVAPERIGQENRSDLQKLDVDVRNEQGELSKPRQKLMKTR